MRKSTLFVLLGLFFFSMALASCKKFEGSQTIPAYIHIDRIKVNCDYYVFGDTTSNIADARVYVDDEIVGCYELPATFPILEKGKHKVAVYAGIKVNGISASRSPYPFYQPMVYNDLNLVEDSIINLQPVLTYYPIGEGVNMAWMEDFENANTLLSLSESDTSVFRISGNEALRSDNSFYSGKVVLPPDSLDFTVATANEFTFHSDYLEYCMLEMDYKCNEAFYVGVLYYKNYKLNYHPLVVVQPTDTLNVVPQRWNKIYINIGARMNEFVDASYFKVYFTSDLSVDSMYGEPEYVQPHKQRYFYFDNLKLIYR